MAPFSPVPARHPRGKNCGGTEKTGCLHPPSYCPLDSARHVSWNGAWVLTIVLVDAGRLMSMNCPNCGSTWWGPDIEQSRPGKERPFLIELLRALTVSVLFFASFLAGSLARERGFHTLFLAGLQVKGVALDLLDDVFLLHLALEPTQSILERFALLKSYFCQTDTPPNPSGWTEQLLQEFDPKSRGRGRIFRAKFPISTKYASFLDVYGLGGLPRADHAIANCGALN
jgi:hypothetical protein